MIVPGTDIGEISTGFLRSWKTPGNLTLLENSWKNSWKLDPPGKTPGNLTLLEKLLEF
jgi:hypothetical protein